MVTEKLKKGKIFWILKIGQKKCPKMDFPKESWKKRGSLYNKFPKGLKEPTFAL
jgi:hypothetical protein